MQRPPSPRPQISAVRPSTVGWGSLVGYLLWTLVLTLWGCAPEAGLDLDRERERGRNALLSGRPDWARHHYGQVVEHQSDDLEVWQRLGQAWGQGQEGGLSRAIEAFEHALALGPEPEAEVEIRLGLAQAWLRFGDSAQALAVLLDLDPDHRVAALRVRCLIDQDPEAAWREIASALEVQTLPATVPLATHEAVRLHRLAAEVALRREDPATALAHVQEAVVLDPLAAETHFLASRVHRQLGETEAMAADLEHFQALQRVAGLDSVAPTSPAERLALLRGLQGGLPDGFVVRQRLAVLSLEAEPRDLALSSLEAVRNDPEQSPQGVLELASVAQRRGWVLEALELYRAVLEAEPEHPAALAQGAVLAAELGETETADHWLDRALATDPDRALFHGAKGRVLLERGDSPGAEASLLRAVELAPWVAADRLLLADLLLARGDRDGTILLLDAAPAAEAVLTAYRRKHSL